MQWKESGKEKEDKPIRFLNIKLKRRIKNEKELSLVTDTITTYNNKIYEVTLENNTSLPTKS